jgi:hypothetical protein
MVSIGYVSFFNRLEEIIESVNENEDAHVKSKMMSTPRKTTPQKRKQTTCNDSDTRGSSNVSSIEVSLPN